MWLVLLSADAKFPERFLQIPHFFNEAGSGFVRKSSGSF
jgi:hypothetical protein